MAVSKIVGEIGFEVLKKSLQLNKDDIYFFSASCTSSRYVLF